jgi:hypothetical protein
MSINELDEENEEELPIGFQAISQAMAMAMAARVARAQLPFNGKQPPGAVPLHAAARAAKAKGPDMAALRRAGSLGRFSQLDQLARDKAGDVVTKNVDPIIGFWQRQGFPVEKLFDILVAEAEAAGAATPPSIQTTAKKAIPDDFGIPESEDDLSLKQVIEIAKKWGIGPGEKAIRNRATKFFKRQDGGTDYNENGRRYTFTREAAISFLRDLKRNTH